MTILCNQPQKRCGIFPLVMPDMIIMESCYSANYWGRLFESHGLKVKLIPAQRAKLFVKGNKNDKHDALVQIFHRISQKQCPIDRSIYNVC